MIAPCAAVEGYAKAVGGAMQITYLGHAGLHIQTSSGTILADPWKNPAYFGSWFVFPDNSGLDWDR
jgi:UDP-MurNAc hydroxylase